VLPQGQGIKARPPPLRINVNVIKTKLNCTSHHSCIEDFLADRTATLYDHLLASSCRPSVCLYVCNAVHC